MQNSSNAPQAAAVKTTTLGPQTPVIAGNGQLPPPPSAPPSPFLSPSPTLGDLRNLSCKQLKDKQNILLDERQRLANRRSAIGGDFERATGASKAGLGDRITTLDHNIVQMETDISALAVAMASKASCTTDPSPGIPGGGGLWRSDDVAGLGFGVFFATLMISSLFWRRVIRRRYRTASSNDSMPPQSAQRLDRIEQAVDTIAVEIERISENQRFMTRLMTETQLAGTIAAVRSSAEAAKGEAANKPG